MIKMNRIKDLRIDADMKQTDLAEAIGIAQQTLSRYENETTLIDSETLKRVADYFEVSTDYVLMRTNKINNDNFTKGLTEEEIQELKKYKEMLIWYRTKKEKI